MKPLLSSLCLALAAVFLQPVVTAHAQSGILLKTFNIKAGKLLLDPNRPRLYATLPLDNSLAVIDTDTNTVTTTFFIGSNPVDLSISPDGTRLYVANGGSTSAAIGVVDLTNLTTLTSLPAPSTPKAIAAGLGNRVYVLTPSSTGENSVTQIDGTTGALETTFGPLNGTNIKISQDGTTLFAAGYNAISSYDVSTATPTTLQTGTDSGGGALYAVSHNGAYLLGQNGSSSGLSLISTSDLSGTVGTFNVGSYSATASFSVDDSLVYAVDEFGGDNGQNAFEIFSTKTFTQLDSFVDPSANSTSGYPETITGLVATAPYGYLYIAETDGTFDNPAGYLELVSTQRAPFFDGSVALSDGFYYLKFSDGNLFGYYNFNFTPYLYHSDLGFEYPFDAADGSNGIYLYDFTSKTFFYTSSSLFPYLYDFTLNTFLYYYPDPTRADHYNTDGTRYFYDFATGQIISK